MKNIYFFFYIHHGLMYGVTVNSVFFSDHNFNNWSNLLYMCSVLLYIYLYIVVIYNLIKWLFLVYLIFYKGNFFIVTFTFIKYKHVIFLRVPMASTSSRDKFEVFQRCLSLIFWTPQCFPTRAKWHIDRAINLLKFYSYDSLR